MNLSSANKNEGNELVVTRIKRDLRSRLDNLAKKKNTTIAALNNLAVERFLDQEEYTFFDLIELIKQSPSLNLHKEAIEDEFNKCPNTMCREIIKIIKDKNAFLFQETFDSISKKLDNLEKENLFGIFLHFSVSKIDINKINEIIQKMDASFKGNKIYLGAGIKEYIGEEKISLFASYNKKEGDKNG